MKKYLESSKNLNSHFRIYIKLPILDFVVGKQRCEKKARFNLNTYTEETDYLLPYNLSTNIRYAVQNSSEIIGLRSTYCCRETLQN